MNNVGKESLDEDKRIEDDVTDERRNSVQVSELKVGSANQVEKNGATSRLQAPSILQVQQQLTQGTVVCWERFLHVRTIRVLLVENDDCTRHVVTALLRNCNYEGMQLWVLLNVLRVSAFQCKIIEGL